MVPPALHAAPGYVGCRALQLSIFGTRTSPWCYYRDTDRKPHSATKVKNPKGYPSPAIIINTQGWLLANFSKPPQGAPFFASSDPLHCHSC